MSNFISVTKFTNAQENSAKAVDVVNNELVTTTNANFYEGVFETMEIAPEGLEIFLKKIKSGEFLTQGIHQILSKGNCPQDARRLKEIFKFSDKPGLLVIDSDNLKNFEMISIDDLNNFLINIEPKLASIMRIYSTSASSYISYNGVDSGLKGVHIFIPISHTLNNASIFDIFHVRAVNAGYAYASITKAGTILIKSPIDLAMKIPNQPIFEGGAILKHPDIKQNHIIEKYDGDVLDADLIEGLSDDELKIYDNNVAKLKLLVQQEAKIIREQYIDKSGNKIKNNAGSISDFAVKTIVKDAINNKLHGEFIIILNDGSPVSVQEILDNKEKYHGLECADPLDNSVFGKSLIYSNQEKPSIHSFAHGGVTYYLHQNFSDLMKVWEINLLEHIENFNEIYANTLIGGKNKIVKKVSNVLDENSISYEFFSDTSLAKVYANTSIQIGEKLSGQNMVPVLKDRFTAWMTHKNSKVFTDGVTFKPNKLLPDTYLNLWTGFIVTPKKGADLSLLKYHIEHIICQDNKELSEYFYNWCAYSFQNPDKPARSAIICKGEKGTGKGMIGHFLRSIWGIHGLHISSSKHLVGNFNSHLMNCCFLFCDEAFFANDRANESTLKSLITEPILMIEKKGLDAIQQQNYLKIFMATNNQYTVPTSKDERRFAVFKVSNEKQNDIQYFQDLSNYLSDTSVQESFLYEMLHRDISNYSPSAIPNTEGLMEEKYNSLSSAGKFLVDLFENFDGKWSESVKSLDLFNRYSTWFDNSKMNSHQKLSQKKFSSYLKQIFGAGKRDDNNRTIAFGRIDIAKEKFEMYEKIDLSLI